MKVTLTTSTIIDTGDGNYILQHEWDYSKFSLEMDIQSDIENGVKCYSRCVLHIFDGNVSLYEFNVDLPMFLKTITIAKTNEKLAYQNLLEASGYKKPIKGKSCKE